MSQDSLMRLNHLPPNTLTARSIAHSRLGFLFGRWMLASKRIAVLPLSARVAVTPFMLRLCAMLAFAAVVLGGLLSAETAEAASFDCAQAKGRLEVLICGDAGLSALDGQEGEVYYALRDTVPETGKEAASLLSEQRDFLKKRTDVCPIPDHPAARVDDSRTISCLKDFYASRIKRLQQRLAASDTRNVQMKRRLATIIGQPVCTAGHVVVRPPEAPMLPRTTSTYAGNLSCSAGVGGSSEIQVNGFWIKVKPSCFDPHDQACDPDEPNGCYATITSAQGKIVYENSAGYSGYSAVDIDPVTGRDINGDGEPDAVMDLDWGGTPPQGFNFEIISLGKKPGLILRFNAYNADFEDLEGNGQIEILATEEDNLGGRNEAEALRLYPLVIVQLKGSKFQDVSSRFWPVFEERIRALSACLDSGRLQLFFGGPQDSSDTEEDVYNIIYDYLYAGRYAEARRALEELWPPDSREQTWKEMVDFYCTGLRADLHLDSGPLCSGIVLAPDGKGGWIVVRKRHRAAATEAK